MTEAGSGAALRRHDLARLTPRAGEAIAGDDQAVDARADIREWIDAARPFVVRQQGPNRTPRTIALGLPLPRHRVRRRVAFVVDRSMIRAIVPPPRLSQIVERMPGAWHVALAQLERQGRALGIVFRVYGSAAWQMLTGLEYVHPASDLDLLWRPRNRAQLDAGVALLEQWQDAAGIAVDGEIVFGDDEAVAWREWRRGGIGEQVLVKRLDGPLLRERAALLHALSGEALRAASAAA